MVARGLSHPFTVCETKKEVLPALAVEGVGAVADPVPPVAAVYHSKFDPLAVKATAVLPWQTGAGLETPGAAGIAFTFTTIAARGPSPQLRV
jgi:hypothetical protein